MTKKQIMRRFRRELGIESEEAAFVIAGHTFLMLEEQSREACLNQFFQDYGRDKLLEECSKK